MKHGVQTGQDKAESKAGGRQKSSSVTSYHETLPESTRRLDMPWALQVF